jgi:hypothetical protein
VIRSVKAGLPPVGTPPPVKGPTEKRKKCECVICDNAFDAALDSSGRVQCPACYTTFTPANRYPTPPVRSPCTRGGDVGSTRP